MRIALIAHDKKKEDDLKNESIKKVELVYRNNCLKVMEILI